MAESAIIETPASEAAPSLGDKFRAEFAKIDPKAAAQNEPPAKEKAAPKAKATTAPTSALDAALDGGKASEQVDPEVDPYKEIDDPKAKPNWEKAREARTYYKGEITKRDTELKTLRDQVSKGDPKSAETIASLTQREQELTKQNETLLAQIKKINVIYDPAHQEKFVAGRQKLIDKAIAHVKSYGGNVDTFADAISLSGKARTTALREALADVDEIDRPRILNVLEQIQNLDDERADLEKDPGKAFEELSASRRAEQELQAADSARLRKQEFGRIATAIADKTPFLRQVDGGIKDASEWNDGIKADVANAEKLLGPDAQYSDIVERSIKGFRYDALEKMFTSTRSELIEAKKLVAEYEGASPDVHSRKRGGEGDTKSKGDKYLEALAAAQGGGEGVM